MNPISHILVPFDFDDASRAALAYAKDLATTMKASIDLLHVVPNPYVSDPVETATRYRRVDPAFFETLLDEARERLDTVLEVDELKRYRAQQAVRLGDPRILIPEYARAEPIDLIAMATHSRSGVAHFFLGSVAERVIRTAPCPVLVVRDGARP